MEERLNLSRPYFLLTFKLYNTQSLRVRKFYLDRREDLICMKKIKKDEKG